MLGGIDGLVFTAGIGENSAEIRRRICASCAWLGVDFDRDANDHARPADLHCHEQGFGMGDPDQ